MTGQIGSIGHLYLHEGVGMGLEATCTVKTNTEQQSSGDRSGGNPLSSIVFDIRYGLATRRPHTALHSAAWNGDLKMVKLLVEAGADLTARDEQYDATPQGWAETSIEVSNNPKCAEVVAYLEAMSSR